MPEEGGGLEVAEVGDGFEGGIQCGLVERAARAGLQVELGDPNLGGTGHGTTWMSWRTTPRWVLLTTRLWFSATGGSGDDPGAATAVATAGSSIRVTSWRKLPQVTP